MLTVPASLSQSFESQLSLRNIPDQQRRDWPGRAKEDVGLIAEKLPFAKIRDGKFRQHPHWPVLAVGQLSKNTYCFPTGRTKHHPRGFPHRLLPFLTRILTSCHPSNTATSCT